MFSFQQYAHYLILIISAHALPASAFEIENAQLTGTLNQFAHNVSIAQQVNTPMIPNELSIASTPCLEPTAAQLSLAEVRFKCNFSNCRSLFNVKNELRTHVLKHKLRHCEECGKRCSNKNQLAFHKAKYAWVHAHGMPQCNGCRLFFKNPERMDSHFEKCDESKGFFITYEFNVPNC